jgi:hypothetical protein
MKGLVSISQLFKGMPDDPLIRFNFELSAFFISLAAIFFLLIIFSRIAAGFAYARRQSMEEKVQDFLSSYIFEDLEDKQAVKEFQNKYIPDAGKRKVVLENLLTLHKGLIGDSADKLRYLYLELGLNNYSKQKLYSTNWDEVATGIVELAEMDIRDYIDLINSFVNHSHPVVRSEAQVATLKLKTSRLFSFLDDLNTPLLDWQQQQLEKAAYKAPLAEIPDFKKWLYHRQETVIIFSLRMISYYGQHNALQDILVLLDHPSEFLREEAIITLRHLESFDAVSKLTAIYARESIDLQLQILKTLPVIGGKESASLYEQALYASDKRLQLAAARALYKSGHEAKNKLDSIKHDLEHPLNALVNYASN